MNWRDYQSRQRVVELGHRFISYVDQGRGESMVLLHGIPTWGFLWSGLLPALSMTHRVLIPDLLGYGYSDRRDCFDRSIARQAEALDAWMDQLGVENALVVGHDVGGGVAQHLALRFPRRVSRLCLMNSVCFDAWPLELMVQLGHPGVARRLSAQAVHRTLKVALKRAGFAETPPEGVVEGLLEPYATDVGETSLVRDAVALNTNQTQELVPKLSHVAVPTRVVWGVDDTILPVKWGARLAWEIPGARLVRVERARHFLMWDQPHAVMTALYEFLGMEARPELEGAGAPLM
ncbi:alpha/beta fold hydrolase [Vitiosangium sp. GDMCC 1.1324]|uniref:alpha/beta fold hydrolase n=1 Tax=Vitiosangium sp. (strain GDMCC 1.1324) TaxID=2138576 RepID=UPI000D3427BE|nr:alpha/beta hydrolase [Vitiosangium sp. GDMCC 1.1324]PTL84983.1 alpha/beta hydrolase [Vitiosangium sp. GDMCC 1.1324]